MTIIDKETWPRRAQYDFFAPMSNPFYTITFPVDITPLRRHTKERGLPFYPAMVYAVTKAMEGVDAFLYRERDGAIVRYDRLVPSFTDLKPGSEQFHIVTLEAGDSLPDFCRRAKAASAAQTEFLTAGPWDKEQLIYFTCLPWFPITSFTNERDMVPSDPVPRAAWGKFEEGKRCTLNLNLELNHRLLDGVHVGQFYRAFNAYVQTL